MYFLYFDPSLGAMILQTVIAAVAGFVLFSKNLISKIKSFFGFKDYSNDMFDDININDDSEVDKKLNSDK